MLNTWMYSNQRVRSARQKFERDRRYNKLIQDTCIGKRSQAQGGKVLLCAGLLPLQPIIFICYTAQRKSEWKRQASITGAVKDNSLSERFWLRQEAASGTPGICAV